MEEDPKSVIDSVGRRDKNEKATIHSRVERWIISKKERVLAEGVVHASHANIVSSAINNMAKVEKLIFLHVASRRVQGNSKDGYHEVAGVPSEYIKDFVYE